MGGISSIHYMMVCIRTTEPTFNVATETQYLENVDIIYLSIGNVLNKSMCALCYLSKKCSSNFVFDEGSVLAFGQTKRLLAIPIL